MEGCLSIYELIENFMNDPLRCLSIKQPWANLVATERKPIETRTWDTKFRGLFLVHASMNPDRGAIRKMVGDPEYQKYLTDVGEMRGKVIAIANLYDCIELMPEHSALSCCDYRPNLFAHVISNSMLIEPIEMKGKLNYFQTDIRPCDVKPLSCSDATAKYGQQLSLSIGGI